MTEIHKIFINSVEEQKEYIAVLIYAGVANYSDKNWSKVLVNKYIDDVAKAFIGSPIVEGHNQPLNDTDPNILGIVNKVFCNGEGFTLKDGTFIKPDGKYYCGFNSQIGKEEKLEEAVKRTGFISTSYLADEVIEPQNGEKFEYINAPYDVEIKSIKPRHVALVTAPRYEDAVIYENEKETIMTKENITDIESKVEVEKGVFISFVSSAAEKGKELLSNIFDNAKKKKNNSDEEEKEEEVKEKDNSKKKKNNSDSKEEDEGKEEKKDNSEDEEMDNSVDVDGEKVSMDDLKNCWKNSKKSNEKVKENSKEEAPKQEVSLEELEAKSFNNSANNKHSFKIGIGEFGYNEFFNSKK